VLLSQNFIIINNDDSHVNLPSKSGVNNEVYFFEHNRPFNLEYHSPISIRYIKEGSINYTTKDSEKDISSNKTFFLLESQDIKSNVDENRATKGFTMLFDPELISELLCLKVEGHSALMEKPLLHQELHISELIVPKAQNELHLFLDRFYFLLQSGGMMDKQTMDKAIEKILFKFIDYNFETYLNSDNLMLNRATTKKEIIRRLYIGKCFIHDNVNNNISLQEIAHTSFLSKYCFQRYFSSFFNISPTDYLVKLRLSNAKKLLKESNQSITAIALSCGYNSSQYFNYSFKNAMGVTPSQYRDL